MKNENLKPYWKDYPEILKKFRSKEEDKLSREVLKVMKKFNSYLERTDNFDLGGDLQGAVHLFQGILITIQKRRINLHNKYKPNKK